MVCGHKIMSDGTVSLPKLIILLKIQQQYSSCSCTLLWECLHCRQENRTAFFQIEIREKWPENLISYNVIIGTLSHGLIFSEEVNCFACCMNKNLICEIIFVFEKFCDFTAIIMIWWSFYCLIFINISRAFTYICVDLWY